MVRSRKKGSLFIVIYKKKDEGLSHRNKVLENPRDLPVFKDKGNSPEKTQTLDRVEEGWGKHWVGASTEGKR